MRPDLPDWCMTCVPSTLWANQEVYNKVTRIDISLGRAPTCRRACPPMRPLPNTMLPSGCLVTRVRRQLYSSFTRFCSATHDPHVAPAGG